MTDLDPRFGAVAVVLVSAATLLIGAFGLRVSRTTSDFYVASRSVSAPWNASAIGGEYLSAASFLGVAGLVLVYGADMLWFPVGYTAGYLVLLVLVAAPLRRSGAYTLPDFAESRLESPAVRRAASVLVVGIGWLYLLPQFQGASIALSAVAGAPTWLGGAIVAGVVVGGVVAGGMRSITFVQAFQYWLKLTAIALPVAFLLLAWRSDGSPGPVDPVQWIEPLTGAGGREHAVYATYSLILALLFGTMGLPHVLVRFYTNPDGTAARRTTLFVIGLLGIFYLFPPLYGVLGRTYLPQLVDVKPDTVVLLLPHEVFPGLGGDLLGALLAAGAFAAFLSTSSGLAISVAGVLSQDLLGGPERSASVRAFRLAAVAAVGVPFLLSLVSRSTRLADTVGLAFAVAASTFCPLLVLGIWWRRLSVAGALAGMGVGGVLATTAVVVTLVGGPIPGWGGALLGQPAAWSVPITFATMVGVSLLTPGQVPAGTARTLGRLHTPEVLRRDERDQAERARP